jgi:uncharacterized protein (TIGR04255 family)
VTNVRKYPHAPVAIAVLEIRHPTSDFLSRGDLAGIKQKLEHIAPLQKAEDVAEFQMVVNGGNPPFSSSRNVTVHRFSSRDKRSSITYSNETIVIETTDYVNWGWFRSFAEAAVSTRQEIAPVDGLERIGLRYIDEIRVPASLGAVNWGEWVAPALLAPEFEYPVAVLKPLQQQAVVQYATETEGDTLTLRYGAVNGPPAVMGGPNLVRADLPEPGPYFLIDTDSAWTLPQGMSVPEMSLNTVVELANRLHAPAEAIFEGLITDRLRSEVLSN